MDENQTREQYAKTTTILNFVGQKVALGPLRRDLLPYYQKWTNDPEVNASRIYTLRPMTQEAMETWYEQASKENNLDNAFFTIYELNTMRPIGTTVLFDISFVNRSAEFGISIGEKDCWNKGYGTESTRLMLDYAFRTVCLHSVKLRTLSSNERAIRAYLRAGFQIAGKWRETHPIDGQLHDIALMDCLASDFFAKME